MNQRSEIVSRLLAELAAGGSVDAAFRGLVEIYYHPLLRFFGRRGFSPEDSRDLTQETFLGIYRGIGSFRRDAGFDTWLFTIAANACRKRHRWGTAEKRRGEEVALLDEGEEEGGGAALPELSPSPAERTLSQERLAGLGRAIGGLPDQMRKCLVLRVHQELKVREIGTLLKISEETVKAHLYQARRRLREALADEPDDGRRPGEAKP